MNRNYKHVQRIHWSFTILYGLFTSLIIIANVAFVGYKFIFQSGILLFFPMITGLLIASLILNNESYKKRYTIVNRYKRVSIVTTLLSFLSIIMIAIYLWNLMYILINECPKYSIIGEGNGLGGDDADGYHHNDNYSHIEMMIIYTHKEKNELKKDVIKIKYNETINEIIHRGKKIEEKNWIESQFEPIINKMDNICLNQTRSRYFFIRDEITEIIKLNREDRLLSKKYTLKKVDIKTLEHDEEDELLLNSTTRYMCKHEYIQMITCVVFLFLMAVLNIMTIGFYIWIYTMK